MIDILKRLEKGIDLGGAVIGIPNGVQEIAIGLIMIGILMFLPTGLTRNREWTWNGWPFAGGSRGS
jgi:branched-chain amino acid transport system permease protein